MDKQNLTLCLMVKNEAAGLRRAVESAREICKEVVIGVDMQSDDETLKLARELSPCVFMFVFNDDFAEVRNNIMKAAQTEWVLWLDGHEFIKEQFNLSEINEQEHDGFLCRMELENEMRFLSPRIIRRDVLYNGSVHEWPVLSKPGVLTGGLIKHDRPGGQTDKATIKRNEQRTKMMLEIMDKNLRKDKKDTRAALHLGIHFQAIGQEKNAINYYKQFLKYSQDAQDIFIVCYQMAVCYMKMEKLKDAEQILKYGLGKCGELWELNLLMGAVKAQQKKHIEAISYFVKSQEPNATPQRYFPIKRSNGRLWDQIASEFFQIKEFEKAATAWERASEMMDDEVVEKLFHDRAELMIKIAREPI